MSEAHGEIVNGKRQGKFTKQMSAQGGSEGPSAKLIAAVVVAVLVVLFVIMNGHRTHISFIFFSWDTTVRWSIFVAVVLGALLDRLLIWGMRRRRDDKNDKDDKDDKDE